MNKFYTDEVNAQIVIALLKANGIRKIIASPGTTNIPITGSVQNDPFFDVYSSVDERSAAYLACGMAHASGQPVVLSCTGATASRNYLSGLTEAYYRKLPVIAITSTPSISAIGHLLPQCIDRTTIPRDVARISVTLPPIKDQEDFWDCEIRVNKALLEATRAGGGPVHINLVTSYMGTFNTRNLPRVRTIRRYTCQDDFPTLDPGNKIAVFIGSHKVFSKEETDSLENFIKSHNAIVLCDHTSAYRGYGRVLGALPCFQAHLKKITFENLKPDLIVHMGEVSGDYQTLGLLGNSEAPVWRVSQDGEIRDRFKRLECVFEMRETDFFQRYARRSPPSGIKESKYLDDWSAYLNELKGMPYELPFSNTWIAKILSGILPANSIVHFGILNSLRNWNFFEIDGSICSMSNVGGFGIDGCISALMGSALINPNKLHFGIVGDLAFFYDINSLGNRHVPKNLRILLVNNGGGGEFELSTHIGSQFANQTGDFISAAGHFGGKSRLLVKHVAEDLGFKYFSAESKESFMEAVKEFVSDNRVNTSMIFECFTDFKEESDALEILSSLDASWTADDASHDSKNNNKKLNATVKILSKVIPQGIRNSIKDALT
jgi:2-succinyl-5-enolpyruvyl-6-hydroxy-3-cyclohexene-1-carboxylate synthase